MRTRLRPPGPVTFEEYEQLPPDDDYRTELSRGWLIREPRPGGVHSFVVGNIYYLLRQLVEESGIGCVVVEGGFRLATDPPTVRGPDVAFITAANVPAEIPFGFLTVIPNLAVEVVSPGNRARQIQAKIADYFDAGVQEVWVVQPRSRTVVIHQPEGESYIIGDGDMLRSELLPGIQLAVREIFAF